MSTVRRIYKNSRKVPEAEMGPRWLQNNTLCMERVDEEIVGNTQNKWFIFRQVQERRKRREIGRRRETIRKQINQRKLINQCKTITYTNELTKNINVETSQHRNQPRRLWPDARGGPGRPHLESRYTERLIRRLRGGERRPGCFRNGIQLKEHFQ